MQREKAIRLERQRRLERERKRKEEEAAKQRKFDAAKQDLLTEIGGGTDELGIKGLSDGTDELGLMGGSGGEELGIMSLKEPEPALRHKTSSRCGTAARQVSRTLKTFAAEAKNRGYQFLVEDVKTTLLNTKTLATVKAYKDFHDQALAQIERLKRAKKNLLRLKSCIMMGCSLSTLNLKINQEFKEWLKTNAENRLKEKAKGEIRGRLSPGTQEALDRVEKAGGFATDFTQRLRSATQKSISQAAKCLGSPKR